MSLVSVSAENIFLLSSVASKIGFDNIIGAFTDEKVRYLIDSGADSTAVGSTVLDELMIRSFDRLCLCKNELYKVVSSVTGKNTKAVAKSDINDFLSDIALILGEFVPSVESDGDKKDIIRTSEDILDSFVLSEV